MTAPSINFTPGFDQGGSSGNETLTNIPSYPHTNGDVVHIAMVSDAASQVFTFPAGYTKQYSDASVNSAATAVLARKTASSEPSSFDVTLGTSERQCYIAFSVTGDGGVNATGTSGTGTGSSATCPAVTTTVDNCLLIRFVATDISAGTTLPHGTMSGWTKLAEQDTGSGGALSIHYKVLATHGTEASATVSMNVSEQWWAGTFAIAPAATSITITLTGIATAQAIGTISIRKAVAPSGIASGQAIGTVLLKQIIGLTGIATAQAMGSDTVAPQAAHVAPSGIASGQAIGSATVRTTVTVTASAISSGATVPTPTVSLRILLNSMASAETFDTTKININVPLQSFVETQTFGTTTAAPQAVHVGFTGMATGAAFGTMQFSVLAQILVLDSVIPVEEAVNSLKLNQRFSLSGVASAAAFGTINVALTIAPSGFVESHAYGEPTLEHITAIQVTGMASAAAFGTPSAVPQSVTIELSAIASSEAIGSVKLNLRLPLSGVASAASVSQPALSITVKLAGIATSAAFGTAKTALTVAASAIASSQAIGAALFLPSTYHLPLTGIATGSAVGDATIARVKVVMLQSVTTAASVNSVSIQVGAVTIALGGIDSAEDMDDPSVKLRLRLTAIATAEALGTTHLGQPIGPVGIASALTFGAWQINLSLMLDGVASAETVPTQLVKFGSQNILLSAIGTGQATGTPALAFGLRWDGIESAAAFGTLKLDQRFALDGIATTSAVSTAHINLALALSGMASGYASGALVAAPNVRILLDGIGTVGNIGFMSVLPQAVTVALTGMASGAIIPAPMLSLAISATGIASGSALGTVVVHYRLYLESAVSVPSFGTATLHTRIYLATVASDGAFGMMILAMAIQPTGISSVQALGASTVAKAIALSGMVTGEAIGVPTLNLRILLVGLASAESVPSPLLALAVDLTSIASGASTGAPTLALRLTLAGMVSAEHTGALTVLPQPVTLLLSALTSAGAMGATRVARAIRPAGIASGSIIPALILFVFLESKSAFRIKRDDRGWTVPFDKRSFTVRR